MLAHIEYMVARKDYDFEQEDIQMFRRRMVLNFARLREGAFF